jgi:hypothetical protein
LSHRLIGFEEEGSSKKLVNRKRKDNLEKKDLKIELDSEAGHLSASFIGIDFY